MPDRVPSLAHLSRFDRRRCRTRLRWRPPWRVPAYHQATPDRFDLDRAPKDLAMVSVKAGPSPRTFNSSPANSAIAAPCSDLVGSAGRITKFVCLQKHTITDVT